MNLNVEQREWMSRLPVGTGIVKLADRHPYPFLIRIPPFPIEKNVADDEVATHMAPLVQQLRYRPSMRQTDPPLHTSGPETVNDAEPASPPGEASPEPKVAGLPFGLGKPEFAYLMSVKTHPFLSKTERNRELGLTAHLGNRFSRALEEAGLVVPVAVAIGRRGRAAIYLELADKAVAVIGHQHLGPGKGGFEHVFHQQRIGRHFEAQGWKAKIEDFREGKSADVGLEKDGKRIAIEVAMSEPGELSNIEKDLAAGWPEVWEVCRDRRISEAVELEWADRRAAWPGATVRFCLLSDPRFDSVS
jgi:hypothetical protein